MADHMPDPLDDLVRAVALIAVLTALALVVAAAALWVQSRAEPAPPFAQTWQGVGR
jgi:hypothetical protein